MNTFFEIFTQKETFLYIELLSRSSRKFYYEKQNKNLKPKRSELLVILNLNKLTKLYYIKI